MNMKKNYIQLSFGNKGGIFILPKTCIVGIEEHGKTIDDYCILAKKKACAVMGWTEEDVTVLNWSYLGSEVHFID